jgi:hypothetical protein
MPCIWDMERNETWVNSFHRIACSIFENSTNANPRETPIDIISGIFITIVLILKPNHFIIWYLFLTIKVEFAEKYFIFKFQKLVETFANRLIQKKLLFRKKFNHFEYLFLFFSLNECLSLEGYVQLILR